MFAKHYYEAVVCMYGENINSFGYCNSVDQGYSKEASFSVFMP